jgi:hypothetical protein
MILLTSEVRRALPPLGTTDAQGMKALAVVKFFTPDAGWTWFGVEFDGEDIFFGLVIGVVAEFGTFRLSELESLHGALGLPVERDLFFEPTSLKILSEQYRGHF